MVASTSEKRTAIIKLMMQYFTGKKKTLYKLSPLLLADHLLYLSETRVTGNYH